MIPEELLAARAQIVAQGPTRGAQASKSFANFTPAHIVILLTAHTTTVTLEIKAETKRACGTWSQMFAHLVATDPVPCLNVEDSIDGVHVFSTITTTMRRAGAAFDKSWQTSCSW